MKNTRFSTILIVGIVLFEALFASVQTTFVAFKSSGWKYRNSYQDATAIGNGSWKTTAYNDAAWSSGQAPLDDDNSAPNHTITTWLWPQNSGRDSSNTPKTQYFRKSFNIANAASYSGYRIKGWCDDGMGGYLNGRIFLYS